MTPLTRASVGLEPTRSGRCPAHTTDLSATPPGPALSSRTTGSPDTLPGLLTGLPVLRRSPLCMHAIATTPAGPLGALVVRLPQRRRPSPYSRRVGSCITLFEACSAFTARYGLHARQVPEGPSTLEASAASLPPRPFQLLPAGTTVAGWDSHPLRERAFHGAQEFRARIRTRPAGSGELEASRTAGRDRHGGLHGGKNQSGGRHHHVAAGATNPRKRG